MKQTKANGRNHAAETTTTTTAEPAQGGDIELEIHLQFDANPATDWPSGQFNALLVQPGPNDLQPWKGANLFLANTNTREDTVLLGSFGEGDIRRVSLAEACEWYACCNPICSSSYGGAEILCQMSARALRTAENTTNKASPKAPESGAFDCEWDKLRALAHELHQERTHERAQAARKSITLNLDAQTYGFLCAAAVVRDTTIEDVGEQFLYEEVMEWSNRDYALGDDWREAEQEATKQIKAREAAAAR
jgi:hypothetical protein